MAERELEARIPSDENEIKISLKKGIWSSEEDSLLINYIAIHGEGRWNYVARDSGLKRTGKSCRLRWKNYLCPNVRRGNFTAEEQHRMADLHRFFGNRWSKIAEYLPGRTDNEIKNYWRTRVDQKHARHLKYDKLSEQIHASPCGNNNYNLGNDHLMINYEAWGSEAIQMDYYWASSLSTDSLEPHQVAATHNLTMNNDCEFYSIESSQPNFGEHYDDPHCTYSDSPDWFSYGELSNMLLNDDWYSFGHGHEIV